MLTPKQEALEMEDGMTIIDERANYTFLNESQKDGAWRVADLPVLSERNMPPTPRRLTRWQRFIEWLEGWDNG